MLYLFDSNVLITASNSYYVIDRVPEYWDWLQQQANRGRVQMPAEMLGEIRAGNDSDDLNVWLSRESNAQALLLKEVPDPMKVQRVLRKYGENLTDAELDEIGNDPFLISYALDTAKRCIVTNEVSAEGKKRKNRKIPDVCRDLGIPCYNLFRVNKELDFKTSWKDNL